MNNNELDSVINFEQSQLQNQVQQVINNQPQFNTINKTNIN